MPKAKRAAATLIFAGYRNHETRTSLSSQLSIYALALGSCAVITVLISMTDTTDKRRLSSSAVPEEDPASPLLKRLRSKKKIA